MNSVEVIFILRSIIGGSAILVVRGHIQVILLQLLHASGTVIDHIEV
jgi:hypothetical protein